ncbi:hypothetical protein ABK040_001511 [Willaertia magna]
MSENLERNVNDENNNLTFRNSDENKRNNLSIEKQLILICIFFRIFIFIWTFLSDQLINDYDTSFFTTFQENSFSLGGFAHWDSVFFLRIAKTGFYEFESFFAFFPLYPFTIRFITLNFILPLKQFFYNFIFLLNNSDKSKEVLLSENDWIISGVLITNICFLISLIYFIKLTKFLFNNFLNSEKDRNLFIWYSGLLFIINPATIFMTVVYTESMFMCFTLLGMYFHFTKKHFLSCLFFFLASATRGNGIVLSGFYIYQFLFETFHFIRNTKNSKYVIFKIIWFFIKYILFGVVMILLPYLLFQTFGYYQFCNENYNNLLKESISINNGMGKTEYLKENHPWCLDKYPHLYNYVQSKYWNVGFLRYYEFKQIPNFILAFPILFLSIYGTFIYFTKDKKRIFTLGLLNNNNSSSDVNENYEEENSNIYTLNYKIFPIVAYWAFLTLYGALLMHIQVLTRFLFSSSPAIYWYCSTFFINGGNSSKQSTSNNTTVTTATANRIINVNKLLIFYFLLYCTLGPLLFSNFYPWT